MSSPSAVGADALLNPAAHVPSHLRRLVGSQLNSPDSALGTGTSGGSVQQKNSPSGRQQNTAAGHSRRIGQPSTSAAVNPLRPSVQLPAKEKGSRNGRLVALPVPISPAERVICQKDFQHIVKETELLIGGRGIGREEMLKESRFSEYLLQREGDEDQLEESKRYYLYDPNRWQYRLYYAREVRLRSESELTGKGKETDSKRERAERQLLTGTLAGEQEEKEEEEEEMMPPEPMRRRHSAGTGSRLRRPVPPPRELGGGGLAQQQMLLAKGNRRTEFPAKVGQEREVEEQRQREEQQQIIRRGAFERNSTSRKPVLAVNRTGSADPPRRRQWSGGVKRAAELKQQELIGQQRKGGVAGREQQQQQQSMSSGRGARNEQNAGNGRAIQQSPNADREQQPPVVTNQLLKNLLRPLGEHQQQPSEGRGPNRGELPVAVQRQQEQQQQWASAAEREKQQPLLTGESGQFTGGLTIPTAGEGERARKRGFWDYLCFWRKGQKKKERRRALSRDLSTESERGAARGNVRRTLCWLLLCPFLLLVVSAAVALLLVIYYI